MAKAKAAKTKKGTRTSARKAKKAAKAFAKKAAKKKSAAKSAPAARRVPVHVRHVNAMAKAYPEFKQLVARYGAPKPTVAAVHLAVAASAGEICMETDCVNGKKMIVRRGPTGDCTEFCEVDC